MPTETQRNTYRALLDHIELCTSCSERRPCETGAWLRQTKRMAEREQS
ncbi:hypothetical protein ACFYWN_37640 [Streptomyces sp. NPDC002917]